MTDFTLETSRLGSLEDIFSSATSQSDRVDLLLARAGGSGGWLNPDIDWTSDERKNLLYRLVLEEWNKNAHLGGTPTPTGQHLEIVQVRADQGVWAPSLKTVGSGVRVGPNVVLTAKHVVKAWKAEQIGFADATAEIDAFTISDVVESDTCDVAALVLAQLPGEGIVPIADPAEVTTSAQYRSVGFGLTKDSDETTQVVKNHLDGIVVYSLACEGPQDVENYHCVPGKELVAGAANGRAFLRDSGGGLLLCGEQGWRLAGIVGTTSAATETRSVRYTRIDAVRAELNEKLEALGHSPF